MALVDALEYPWGPCRTRGKPHDYCIFVIPCKENKKRIEKANRRSEKQRSTIRKSFLFGIVKQKKARYKPIVNQKAREVYNVTFYSYFIHISFISRLGLWLLRYVTINLFIYYYNAINAGIPG